MEILTLEETISWMEKCITEGTDYEEDFWSNFSDAFMYLQMYRDVLSQFMKNRRNKQKEK